jgi:hypothetical protein
LDLPTHFAFAFPIGLIFFDKPEIAVLVAIGTIFPDLDGEYWFIRVIFNLHHLDVFSSD